MSPDKPRPRAKRCGIEFEEERAWVGFYKRVGRDPVIAAEVMAQLEADVDMKRTHLALYLCCKESLRVHKARQARNKRIGQFVRGLGHALLVRPMLGLRTRLRHGGDIVVECLPDTRKEPALQQVRRLGRDAEFAAAQASFEQQGSSTVSKYAIFTVRGAQYSAPSQLIGQRLTVRLYSDHIECWLGGTRVLERARLSHRDGQRHPRDIDYRHLIAALRRKPGAFARSVLRDAMFPRAVYRQTWERLSARLSEREACKSIVGLLALAADGHEAQLATELEQLIELDQLPDLLALSTLLAPRRGVLPDVLVELPDLAGFDALLGVQA